jgi:sugar phosphate isomerase/epimerase
MKNRIKSIALIVISLVFAMTLSSSSKGENPNSNFDGVNIGVITYSWRSMPSTMDDIIKYCQETNISSLELMGNILEADLGAPTVPRKPRGKKITKEESKALNQKIEKATAALKEWRLAQSMDTFKAVKKKFDKAGISIHIVKFMPATWSDEETDYAFKAAKAIGANAVCNEIGLEACERLGKFAEKHDMYAVFHNHKQPGEPDFSFDTYLDLSPNVMLNFDMGHYWGVTDVNPVKVIEKYHDRIYSIHLKDKSGKSADIPNKNYPWGEATTPLEDVLKTIQKNNWSIYCDIELEYDIPEGSDAVKEVAKCVKYAENILLED